MTTFYNKEKAKYGNITGQVIIWPVTYIGDPDSPVNKAKLPAGYLKCDGTKYLATDYPRLAAILGTGSNTAFIRRNLDGTDFDNVPDTQFMVPDLGSKYPEPTTGANAGVYNNIRKNDENGTEKSRSGVGIDSEAAIGDTNVTVTYSGSINVPSQEVDVRGKPGWTYSGATHYTESEAPDENQFHPHLHFTDTVRSRLRSNPSISETSNNHPRGSGNVGLQSASTINVDEWLDATLYNNASPKSQVAAGSGFSSNPAASGQEACNLLDAWDPNDDGDPLFEGGVGTQTGYYGGCIADDGNSSDPYRIGGGSNFEFACLNKVAYSVDRTQLVGSPDRSETAKFKDTRWVIFCLGVSNQGTSSRDQTLTVDATYTATAIGMPRDYNNNVLTDVLPLQSNQDWISNSGIINLSNEVNDTANLTIASGTLPTLHNHRVRLEKGTHDYKVKTDAITIDPENLSTTFDIGVDKSISIDSSVQPFIVMEYLIKI